MLKKYNIRYETMEIYLLLPWPLNIRTDSGTAIFNIRNNLVGQRYKKYSYLMQRNENIKTFNFYCLHYMGV